MKEVSRVARRSWDVTDVLPRPSASVARSGFQCRSSRPSSTASGSCKACRACSTTEPRQPSPFGPSVDPLAGRRPQSSFVPRGPAPARISSLLEQGQAMQFPPIYPDASHGAPVSTRPDLFRPVAFREFYFIVCSAAYIIRG